MFFKRAQSHGAISATAVLVETLLDNGVESEWRKPRQAVDRLTAAISDDFVLGEIMLLRMRARCRARKEMTLLTGNSSIAIAPWRNHVDSRDT